MNQSMETEKIMFWREARSALRPAVAAFGSASPPPSTLAALASTTRWFFQMIIQTLAAIRMPSTMPTLIATSWPLPAAEPFMKFCQ